MNRVVRHFQLLFGVKSIAGCVHKLNEVLLLDCGVRDVRGLHLVGSFQLRHGAQAPQFTPLIFARIPPAPLVTHLYIE